MVENGDGEWGLCTRSFFKENTLRMIFIYLTAFIVILQMCAEV